MRRPCPGRASRLLLLLPILLGLVVLALTTAPASAHTALSGSDPAPGATVTTPLVVLTLRFSEPVSSDLAQVVVTAPEGGTVSDGPARVDGAAVAQRLRPLPVGGRYDVAFRVVADDGHPITGRYSFTASGAAVATPDAAPSTPAADRVPGNEPEQGVAEGAGQADTEDDAGTGGRTGGADSGWVVPVLVAALAAAALALVLGAVRAAGRARDVAQ